MRSGTGAQRGFSLIELMVSISVLAILLSIAVPSFRDASLSSQLRSSSNDLVASTHFARSEALKRNTVVTLCVSSDGTTCGAGGWEQGWIVVAGATLLNYHAATPSGLKITDSGGATTLAFQPTGIGATPASLTVCRAAPSAGPQERVVTIDASGRAHVRTTMTGICS